MKTKNMKTRSSRMRTLNENKEGNAFGLLMLSSVDTDKYDVILENNSYNKMSVIKAIRELTGLDLRDSKNIADSTPSTVLTGVSKDKANEAKEKLEAAGATASVIPSENTLSSSSCPQKPNPYSNVKGEISWSNITVEKINNNQYNQYKFGGYDEEEDTVYFMYNTLNENIKVINLERRNEYDDDDECKQFTYIKNRNTILERYVKNKKSRPGPFSFLMSYPKFPWHFIVIGEINDSIISYFYIDVDVNGEVTTSI